MSLAQRRVTITDPSLRDGSHAIQHQLSLEQIADYCRAAEAAGIPVVEVGHGNGLAASSLQLGFSRHSDADMIRVAREHLASSQLGVFMIPGFGTIARDLEPAIDLGADVVRIGTHCTEADIGERHVEYARNRGKPVYGCLLMSHMAQPEVIAGESEKLQSYGANGVILMDSAGALLPDDVKTRVRAILDRTTLEVGFHGHNNLGMAVANSLAAVEAGACILDATSRGFGAGAGNTALEILVGVLCRLGVTTGIDLYKVLDLSDYAEQRLMKQVPHVKPTSIVSGMAGVVSTFSRHVDRISSQYGVDPRDVFFELGRRKVVAGQEDMILEAAVDLSQRGKAVV